MERDETRRVAGSISSRRNNSRNRPRFPKKPVPDFTFRERDPICMQICQPPNLCTVAAHAFVRKREKERRNVGEREREERETECACYYIAFVSLAKLSRMRSRIFFWREVFGQRVFKSSPVLDWRVSVSFFRYVTDYIRTTLIRSDFEI